MPSWKRGRPLQGIEREVRTVASRGGVVWIGYSVPMAVASRRSFDNNSYGACWLGGWGADGNSKTANELVSRGSRVRLEASIRASGAGSIRER